ncbi:MAG: hypothetical protein VKI42_10265 [Synechococcaceae cyanobacterium]|nr:hypothetical protein [Synechococcaceae cyanobacterium]
MLPSTELATITAKGQVTIPRAIPDALNRRQRECREEALAKIRETIGLGLEMKAEEAGVKPVETLELAV